METETSKANGTFTVANGGKIMNKGEKNVSGITGDGKMLGMKMQVTQCNKILASVARMTDRGNRVVFEKDSGYIENLKPSRR